MLVQDQYKFIWYFGYDQIKPDSDYMELYDIDSDPEEMKILLKERKTVAEDLLAILKSKISNLNKSIQDRKSS